jgi:hypothetical protein
MKALIEIVNGRKIGAWTGQSVAPQNGAQPRIDSVDGRMLERLAQIEAVLDLFFQANGHFSRNGAGAKEAGKGPRNQQQGTRGKA